jgi:hypothetical protein
MELYEWKNFLIRHEMADLLENLEDKALKYSLPHIVRCVSKHHKVVCPNDYYLNPYTEGRLWLVGISEEEYGKNKMGLSVAFWVSFELRGSNPIIWSSAKISKPLIFVIYRIFSVDDPYHKIKYNENWSYANGLLLPNKDII